MLNQDAMTPLYVQLMDEVEQAINNGIYKPGDRIMTEAEMAKKKRRQPDYRQKSHRIPYGKRSGYKETGQRNLCHKT